MMKTLNQICKQIVPPLSADLHKGQAGRIAIIGGSAEYTGAPYFAGITALHLGADLVHVMCVPSAAQPIKSYSPDLMVHPILCREKANDFGKWLDRLHSIVLGPGLGRDEETIEIASEWINLAKLKKIPIIIDADGLHIITEDPGLIRGYPDAILTPNKVEFERLYHSLTGKYCEKPISQKNMLTVSNKLKCSIVCKGPTDMICTGDNVIECAEVGSFRRCGGQGDILSGAMGIFSYWARSNASKLDDHPYQSVAGFAACSVARRAGAHAYASTGRSMITSSIIPHLPKAFDDVFIGK